MYFCVLNGVFIHFESQETDHAFVAAILSFEDVDDVAFRFELDQEVKAGGLFLDRVGEFLESPLFAAYDPTAVLGDDTLEFAEHLFGLNVRQHRRGNENGFVMIHNDLI